MHRPHWPRLGNAETRASALRWMSKYTFSPLRSSIKWLGCIIVAFLLSYLPIFQDALHSGQLSDDGVWMLRILFLAAGLWLTEAIPAYATAMLVMALELIFLSTASGAGDWKWSEILAVWGSPLIWLFFGGFLIAEAFREANLDSLAAMFILKRTGTSYFKVTLGLTITTFLLSMFMSNTATITVMIAIVAPLLIKSPDHDKQNRGLLLSLAVAASLGGMTTIVGTPPNALAVASLATINHSISFLQWIALAGPVAVILLVISLIYIKWVYFRGPAQHLCSTQETSSESPHASTRVRGVVLSITLATIGMWFTQPLHGISPTVSVFLAITALTLTGVLTSQSLQHIPWDILILMAGGLALGKGISESGLSSYLSSMIPTGAPTTLITLAFSFLAVIASNFMSNTAAANALLPIIIAVSGNAAPSAMIPATLACSCAILLPVSTPPNAICYSTNMIKSHDFVRLGLIFIALGPTIAFLWLQLIT